eukprot:TRINITY_DN107052_c0_g1_i1.p1 TRINITY_DN107052_c0_g1~~TRINITY_DN107052_c0_g1_i1.p1  ORF type:complete len:296 (+),score=42.26 TRINITY_DN107052_c0_g1_i1:113-1000(+)
MEDPASSSLEPIGRTPSFRSCSSVRTGDFLLDDGSTECLVLRQKGATRSSSSRESSKKPAGSMSTLGPLTCILPGQVQSSAQDESTSLSDRVVDHDQECDGGGASAVEPKLLRSTESDSSLAPPPGVEGLPPRRRSSLGRLKPWGAARSRGYSLPLALPWRAGGGGYGSRGACASSASSSSSSSSSTSEPKAADVDHLIARCMTHERPRALVQANAALLDACAKKLGVEAIGEGETRSDKIRRMLQLTDVLRRDNANLTEQRPPSPKEELGTGAQEDPDARSEPVCFSHSCAAST